MKKILLSGGILVAVAALAIGATVAFYNDTETSTGNIFTAGSIDLKVDQTFASYNGVPCVGDCIEEGNSLVLNGGFESPDVPNGGWAVFTNADVAQTNWTIIDGAGLEIQDHAAGNPHGGDQLAELDSHNANSQTTIQQVINTVPGQKYRLTFWHSARPGNNAGDNKIKFTVKVTSTDGIMINDTVYAYPIPGGSQTQWTKYTYNFVALNNQTTVQFADVGNEEDTYGGYLDDISVKTLNCFQNPSFPNGGICSVWGERDLDQGNTFWNFPDIKPGDFGANIISLHVYDNDAYACLFPTNVKDDENTPINPELKAGDTTDNGIGFGEMSQELKFFIWKDNNNNAMHDFGEKVYVPANTPFNQVQSTMIAMSLTSGDPITLVGMRWCAGTQTGPATDNDMTPVGCNGSGMSDKVQTDKLTSDFVAYAVQQRNNSGFSCSSIDPSQLPKPQ